MPYKLCLFDLDGTLVDPMLGITKSFQYALSAFGIHEELENLTGLIGPPLRDSLRQYVGIPESDIEKAVFVYREYYAKQGVYQNELYPEIPQLLDKLVSKGRILAIVTNKPSVYAEQVVEHMGLDKYFTLVNGDELDGSLTRYGKREIIRMALDALDPERDMSSVVIGDRSQDVNGARDNGIDSIGVTWGYGSRAELEEAGATFIVSSPDDLKRLIC